MQFKNKVIWITGASSGIGEAVTYKMNQLGANLIISSRTNEALYKVKSNCKGNPMDIHVLPLDLADAKSLPEKAAAAEKIYGHIDMIIHSGGVSQRSLAIETDLSVARSIMDTNFWGAVVLTQTTLPGMIARNVGHIVIISSLVGKFGTKFRSAYSASKHALHGYFDSLRTELTPEIKITLVCPGFIKTNITYNALKADGSRQNTMDDAQATGMLPLDCAEEIVNAIQANKQEVYIGGKEKYGVLLKRFFPDLFSRVIRKAKVT